MDEVFRLLVCLINIKSCFTNQMEPLSSYSPVNWEKSLSGVPHARQMDWPFLHLSLPATVKLSIPLRLWGEALMSCFLSYMPLFELIGTVPQISGRVPMVLSVYICWQEGVLPISWQLYCTCAWAGLVCCLMHSQNLLPCEYNGSKHLQYNHVFMTV